jgi:tetratricopeptide (TPR) repeat protein
MRGGGRGAGRLPQARQVVDAALARDPRDPVALYMLGRIAIDDGQRIEQGIEGLATYVTLENRPQELGLAAAWWRKGLLYERVGRKDEAVGALRKAIELDARLEAARKDLQRLES